MPKKKGSTFDWLFQTQFYPFGKVKAVLAFVLVPGSIAAD